MKIPGWLYLAVGLIVSSFSGYVYLFIPKNGRPNMAMAVFFVIGLIFILVGVIKLIISAAEKKSEIKSVSKTEIKNTALSSQQEIVRKQQELAASKQSESLKRNLVEEQISSQYTKQFTNGQNSNSNSNTLSHHSQHQQNTSQHNSEHHSPYIHCSGCSASNYSHSNFCHICGRRLN